MNISSVVKQVFGKLKLVGQDGTLIGNVSDRLKIQNDNTDILGVGVTGRRANQIEISFFGAPNTDLITNTTAGTGAITQANGHTLYQTGTGATASAKGVSVGVNAYRPAHESYAFFTAGFTSPIANSHQRIGLYDTNNGFYIGYEGITFGITKRTAGVNTFIARTSFNTDLLDGSANSKFKRDGAPEAINLQYSNLFRIRYAWLGSASILFEVFCADGYWVTFHTIKVPNSQVDPSVTIPNLPMTLDVAKSGADATNLIIYTACWAAGTTGEEQPITTTLTDNTLATLSRSIIAGRASTGGGTYYNVKVTPSGALLTEAAISDITAIVGQETMANSLPVAIASDQSTIPVKEAGAVVSTANSTSTLLNANATFTGTSEEVTQYGVINIVVRSDVASATDGLQFLFSTDNVNFYSSDEYTILAGKFKTYSLAPVARYFKIQYTNGAANQSQFLLQTIYKQVYTKPSSHRLQDTLSPQDDAEVMQSVLVAKLPDGTFTNIRTTTEGHLISDFAQNQKDAFDRLIVVQPTEIESFDHRISKHADDFDELIVGSATSVLNTTTATVDLTTTTGATDSVIRQSYQSFQYTRGNSQQGLFSLNLGGGPKANNIRYFGLGDNENGAFIGVDGTGFFVMRRSKTSGSVVDTKVYQSAFNKDKLDGTGASGVTLDLSKQNLFSITYSWLGTNAIIYTVTIGGIKYPFHVETVGNVLDTAWCQSGQLPLYFANTNTGTTASSTLFKVGCSSVFSIGSSQGFVEYQSVSSIVTPITISTAEKVCAGIRLRPGLKYVSIEPADYQLMPASGTSFAYYKVIFRPTLTGDTWTNQGDISQILTSTPTYTGGTIIQEGYLNLTAGGRIAVNVPSTLETTLGYSINGTPDSLIIVVRTDSGNGSVYFVGSWKEIF